MPDQKSATLNYSIKSMDDDDVMMICLSKLNAKKDCGQQFQAISNSSTQ